MENLVNLTEVENFIAPILKPTIKFLSPLHECREWILKTRSPVVKDFPMLDPYEAIGVIVGYLLIVAIGIRVMRNREKVNLGIFPSLHNILLVLLSAYMGFEIIRQANKQKYNFWCNPVDHTPSGIGMSKILWIFYFSKVIEFGDTFIMILKKILDKYHFCIFIITRAFFYFGGR